MTANKVAMITGAGSGIGRAIAIQLFSDGYSLALAGRRREALEETAQLAGTNANRVLVFPSDVANPADVISLFDATDARFGRLDLLFNNAGIFTPAASIEEVSLEHWQAAIDVNLTGAFLCTQQAFRLMKKQQPRGGRIINNGSISSHVPRPRSATYTATKHAMTGLTKVTSLDGRQYDIACGQIDIGNASTDMTQKMQRGILQANGTIAVEPTMDVQHVARAVSYMASLPLDANVQFMTVMATSMPFIGRGQSLQQCPDISFPDTSLSAADCSSGIALFFVRSTQPCLQMLANVYTVTSVYKQGYCLKQKTRSTIKEISDNLDARYRGNTRFVS